MPKTNPASQPKPLLSWCSLHRSYHLSHPGYSSYASPRSLSLLSRSSLSLSRPLILPTSSDSLFLRWSQSSLSRSASKSTGGTRVSTDAARSRRRSRRNSCSTHRLLRGSASGESSSGEEEDDGRSPCCWRRSCCCPERTPSRGSAHPATTHACRSAQYRLPPAAGLPAASRGHPGTAHACARQKSDGGVEEEDEESRWRRGCRQRGDLHVCSCRQVREAGLDGSATALGQDRTVQRSVCSLSC